MLFNLSMIACCRAVPSLENTGMEFVGAYSIVNGVSCSTWRSKLIFENFLYLSIILGMVFVGAIALLAGLTCVMDASASGRERSKVSRRPKTSCNASRSLALISIVAEEMDFDANP